MSLWTAVFVLASLSSVQRLTAIRKHHNFVVTPAPVSYLHYHPHETKIAQLVQNCYLYNKCTEVPWRLMYNAITKNIEMENQNRIGRGLLQFRGSVDDNQFNLPFAGGLLKRPITNNVLHSLSHGKQIIERVRPVTTEFLNPLIQILPQWRALNNFNDHLSYYTQPPNVVLNGYPNAPTITGRNKIVYTYTPKIEIDATSDKYFVNVRNIEVFNNDKVSDETSKSRNDAKRFIGNIVAENKPAKVQTVLCTTTAKDLATTSNFSQIVCDQEVTKSTSAAKIPLAQSTPATLLLEPTKKANFETTAISFRQQSQNNSRRVFDVNDAKGLPITVEDTSYQQRRKFLLDKYTPLLDKLDRTFYTTTFNKLLLISPPGRQENGISFVQSGLFLSLLLMAVSTETDPQTAMEIDNFIGFRFSHADKIDLISEVISSLPKSDDDSKWRWASRLVLRSQHASEQFRSAATALCLKLGHLNGTESPEQIMDTLNKMVEEDTAGTVRDTFEPDEVSEGVRDVAVTSMYLRARWRSAPTVLNGTRPFRDAAGSPARRTRMIRINDVMRYVNLDHFGCQAVEISYATPGLTLLILVPDGSSLKSVVRLLDATSIADITSQMDTMRVAVTMPLYTLRMTLLLPSKLESMGVHRLINWRNDTDGAGGLRLSHAVQRLMFWAEAGRNAFKDDGIEWDQTPELELVVDRPYTFFVRWHNLTLMNGNFVL